MALSTIAAPLKITAGGDTAAGDDAAIGVTAAEGLILTGQGSTNDVTIKNDADADVIEIPTGTTNVTVAGTLGTGGLITSGAGITGAGLLTTGGNIVIPNGGNIGSAGDADAIAIASNGVVTFSQIPSGNFISHIDQWRLTTNFTGDVDAITSNLERVDTDGGALLGSAMTQSSGVFTFPVTGLWLIQFIAFQGSSANNNDAQLRCEIDTATDGSSFSQAALGTGNTHGTGGAAEATVYVQFIFDVTNVTTHKVRFNVDPLDGNNTTTKGTSTSTLTNFTFTRLGDT